MEFKERLVSIRNYFNTSITRDYNFRIFALNKLKETIKNNENLIYEALSKDLNKSSDETYLCEIGMVYEEINFHLKHLKKWMKKKTVKTPLHQFSAKSFRSPEPYGVTLIISPWNYPFQLAILPLVGSISAGNCTVIKPSSYSKETSLVINKIITEAFPQEYIYVIDKKEVSGYEFLDEKFDYIFFTGSLRVGKIVMEKASKYVTPVSLELGGKSPVIVDKTANIHLAAKRVAFGKVLNAGQTCVAPDYLFIDKTVKNEFVIEFKKAIQEFFPTYDFSDYPNIINDHHFERLVNLLENQNILIGGTTNASTRFIEPTLLDNTSLDSPIMQEEIFGPILPMIEYDTIDECIKYITNHPKPLAFYLFTNSKKIRTKVINNCSFGGGCINDTIIHLATSYMPFGGVGESGMGSYHGKASFDTFTHYRSIINKKNWIDLSMRYRPYNEKNSKIIKKFMR